MRLAWATDIHLNAADAAATESFVRSLLDADADALLVTGDIGEAGSVEGCLEMLAGRLARPVYFVLGNHDYYFGSIAGVRARMRALSSTAPRLRWLPAAGVVPLTAHTALVGHDGWADGRLGAGTASRVIMNDYLLIEELAEIVGRAARGRTRDVDAWLATFWATQAERFAAIRALGEEAAGYARATLPAALDQFPNVVFLTHVPPFSEASWHEGVCSDDEWLPHVTCAALGAALREAAAARPDRRLTVLCGHTHGSGTADVLPNLRVVTGGAQYGRPALQRVLDVE